MFDGGAPILKRQTVTKRRQRREGRREDAVRTASRLLAVQMQRKGEEEVERRKRERETGIGDEPAEEEVLVEHEQLVYADENAMSAQERQANRKFFKKDAYHLPELAGGIEGMGQPNDPRIMSTEELEDYARHFHNGEDINLYDFSKIDFDGDFFTSLPPGDRYNILNAARLRSRLRMGLSKEQLDDMFPDRMAFSRFQIDRVRERNDLTQRLMNLNGMNGVDTAGGGRIAGERGREYVLVRNEGVEGGWALGVVSGEKSAGKKDQPIDVDARDEIMVNISKEESDDEFEDVPVEGLNRLPKLGTKRPQSPGQAIMPSRKRNRQYEVQLLEDDDPNNLFVTEREPVLDRVTSFPQSGSDEEDEEAHLARAIALSLQQQQDSESDNQEDLFEDVPYQNEALPTYEQKAVEVPKPITTTNGKMVAHIVNIRASAAVPKRRAVSISSASDDEMDLQAVLKKTKRSNSINSKKRQPAPVAENIRNSFDGPLPFETINFGTSIFSRQPARPNLEAQSSHHAVYEVNVEDSDSGGFVRSGEAAKPKALPPWLAAGVDIREQVKEQQQRDLQVYAEDKNRFEEDRRRFQKEHGVVQVDSSDEDSDIEVLEKPSSPLGLLVDLEAEHNLQTYDEQIQTRDEIVESALRHPSQDKRPAEGDILLPETNVVEPAIIPLSAQASIENSPDEEVEWSDSDAEDIIQKPTVDMTNGRTTVVLEPEPALAESSTADHRVDNYDQPLSHQQLPSLAAEDIFARETAEIIADIDADEFSDSGDEELMAQLATEAEEHARFASTLNQKSQKENQESYEQELRALRSQQKKDRRDADEVSHIMVTECQALLRLFGIPYITAPMEAEAQCAELVRLKLVDGIVTDDSDIFLFGGTRVYKNMFNSNKFVECYLAADIEKELSLSRQNLISIAHLLGSDYTEGLTGVGPVTAVEILSEFPSDTTGLQDFADWWQHVQSNPLEPVSSETSTFRKKFRRTQAAKLFLPPAFPVQAVTDAYLHPEVDSGSEAFQWGVPDLDKLRDFLMATIGWSQERTDEVLVPVIRDMNRRETEGTQSNITRFFDGGIGAGARHADDQSHGKGSSKRMQDAVGKLKAKSRGGGSGVGAQTLTMAGRAKEWARKENERENGNGTSSRGRKGGVKRTKA